MTDQGERIAKLEGDQRLLESQVKQSVDGVRSALDNVQLEVRGLAHKLDALADLKHTQEGNREAISEMKETLNGMSANIERCFSEIETDNAKWRSDHERDNNDTKNKLFMWHGIALAVVLVGGSLVGGFVYFLNYRFNEQAEAQKSADQDIRDNRNRIDALKDRQHAIELIQAQQRPQQPGNPQ